MFHNAVETTEPSSTTTTTASSVKSTTLEPRYTEIITKMKEMRRNRLTNRFGSSLKPDESDIDTDDTDDAGDEKRTTPMSINLWTTKTSTSTSTTTVTTTTTTTTTTTSTTEENKVDNSEENDGDEESDEESDEDDDLDKLKSSKFLRFEKEIELAYKKRTERRHDDDDTPLDNSNDIVTLTEEEQQPSSTTSSEKSETVSQSFYVYPDNVPAIKTYTVEPDTEIFCEYQPNHLNVLDLNFIDTFPCTLVHLTIKLFGEGGAALLLVFYI